MARLGIKRANGDIEYAELTTDKSLVGSHYLTVEKDGTPYYAKLDDNVSTHLCVEGSDGQKRYVQKEVKFVWKYVRDDSHPIDGLVIPKTGKYKLYFHKTGQEGVEGNEEVDEKYYNVDTFSIGTKFNNWVIQSTSGKLYNATTTITEGEYWEEGFKDILISLESIEYIGEA